MVVLDTAPTGHALLLLDAAESDHLEVARTTSAHIPDVVRTRLPRLRNAHYTKMLLVTLAEATPVLEAARLREDLRRAGIEPFGWVVNASLEASGTRHLLLAARARLDGPYLERVSALAKQGWLVRWKLRLGERQSVLAIHRKHEMLRPYVVAHRGSARDVSGPAPRSAQHRLTGMPAL